MIVSASSPSPAPSVTFWGAARAVSGSMHVLETAAGTVLLDAGLNQGRKGEADRRNTAFPFHPNQIAAVVVTHAHIDHCGNLPTLTRMGFRGPVFATPVTADLAAVMLADAAKVQEEESAHANIRRHYAGPWIEPLFSGPDAARATGQFRRLPYDTPLEILPGVTLSLAEAGHLPGSAAARLDIRAGNRKFSLNYSGDLGRYAFDVLPQPAPLVPAGLVIAESTYGARRHPDMADTLARLAEVLTRTNERGGKCIVPAFSLGRTQLVVHFILELMRTKRAPRLPVFVDSPLAAAIADVFRAHPGALRIDLAGDEAEVRYVQSFEESLALLDRPGPGVIVASGGMCEGGRIVQHLARTIDDERNTICLVSYLAARTLGRQILDRPHRVHFLGKDWPLWADVVHLEGFSGHADQGDLLRYLAPMAGRTSKVALVHGEQAAAEALGAELRRQGIADVLVPAPGDRVEIPADE